MTEHDDLLERVIDTLKEPVTIDPGLDRRVMAEVEQLPALVNAARARPLTAWLSQRWTVRLSPFGALAAAAGVAALVVAGGLLMRSGPVPNEIRALDQSPPRRSADSPLRREVMQFVLVAPEAESVALVGDFNDWSLAATRLMRQPGDGVWWVTVQLPPGRYRYAFVVNGETWRSDPSVPGVEDEFGRPNSVVTIGGA